MTNLEIMQHLPISAKALAELAGKTPQWARSRFKALGLSIVAWERSAGNMVPVYGRGTACAPKPTALTHAALCKRSREKAKAKK